MQFTTNKIIVFLVLCFCTQLLPAQRYAVIDTKYILNQMPEYVRAEADLKKISTQWEQEIGDKQTELNRLYKIYSLEQYMLTDDLKGKRELEIANKEKEVQDLQRRRFGFEGDLFHRRQTLIKPVQDRVYNAIQKVASDHFYDFILDKSEGITVIFVDPKLDKSNEVLQVLGIATNKIR